MSGINTASLHSAPSLARCFWICERHSVGRSTGEFPKCVQISNALSPLEGDFETSNSARSLQRDVVPQFLWVLFRGSCSVRCKLGHCSDGQLNKSPLWGSSPRPYAYEAHALPTELRRHLAHSASIAACRRNAILSQPLRP